MWASESAFELCERIEPVAILYGRGRVHVTETNSSCRLLLELHRLGRHRVRLRGMICRRGALTRRSLWALNCYLRHVYGRKSLQELRAGFLHRHCWYDLQRAVRLEWR